MNPYLQELEMLRAESSPQQPTEDQVQPSGENPFLKELDQLRGSVKPKKEKEAWYEDLAEGVAVSGMGTYYGMKDLLGLMDDEDRATLKDWKDDAGESGWGTLGRVLGEVGQLAVPAGWAGKAAKGASWLKNASRLKKAAALMGGEAALGAGYGGIRLPEEGESRAKNAAKEAGLNVAGLGLAKTLGKMGKGFAKSGASKAVEDEGVRLAASQRAEGIPEVAEELMSFFPMTSRSVKKLREEGEEGWVNLVLNKANPTGAEKITGIGSDAFRQLKNNVKKGYDDAWGKVTKVADVEDFSKLEGKINSLEGKLTKDEFTPLKRVLEEVQVQGANPTKEGFKALDRKISKELRAAASGAPSSGKAILIDALEDLRKSLRSSLNDEAQNALKTMDSNYRKYLIVQDVADKASKAETEGLFTPNMLNASIGKFSNKGGRASGSADLYDVMRQGRETVGKEKLGGVLGKVQRAMQQIPVPSRTITKGFLDSLTGDTAIQRQILKSVESPVGRALRRSPVALNDEEY